MDNNRLALLEEELRQLRLLRMNYNNAKRKADRDKAYDKIKENVGKLFKEYNLSKYDPAFTTSSSMWDLDHMFYDLNTIIDKIKKELE